MYHIDNFMDTADALESRLMLNDCSLEVGIIYHEDITTLRNKFKLRDMVGVDPITIEEIPEEYRKFCVLDFIT
jgi:small ligand-binding sensory domain FIST